MQSNFAVTALALCREQVAILASGIDTTLVGEKAIEDAGRILGATFRKAYKGSKETFDALYAAVRMDAQMQDEAMEKIHGAAAYIMTSAGRGKGMKKRGKVLSRVSALASKVRKEFAAPKSKGASLPDGEPDAESAAKESAANVDTFEPAFLLVCAEAESALSPTKHAAFLKLATEVAKYHKAKIGK